MNKKNKEMQEILRSNIQNNVLLNVYTRTAGKVALIIDPGQYRCSSAIGILNALINAGLVPNMFSHIILNSSSVLPGIAFASGRWNQLIKFSYIYAPMDFTKWGIRNLREGNILQTEDMLRAALCIQDGVSFEENNLFADTSKDTPEIHICTTDIGGGESKPGKFSNITNTTQDFNKALIATFTIPGWSGKPAEINNSQHIDGFFANPVMYDTAQSLEVDTIVKISNVPTPHLYTPKTNESRMIEMWLRRFPHLAYFYQKKRPGVLTEEVQRMYDFAQSGKNNFIQLNPFEDAFESPLVTGRKQGFQTNIELGNQAGTSILLDAEFTMPIRENLTPKKRLLDKIIGNIWSYIET